MRPQGHAEVDCPLLTGMPSHDKPSKGTVPTLLDHLNHSARSQEPQGLLFIPDHILAQLNYWQIQFNTDQSVLAQFAALQPPFQHLISPHPLFDCQHYLRERRKAVSTGLPTSKHPLLDYIRTADSSSRLSLIATGRDFNPTLWESLEADLDARFDGQCTPPLIRFLNAMDIATTSCPINPAKVGGVVEELNDAGVLIGWCHQRIPGVAPELKIMIAGVVVGRGKADLPRSDVARRGIERIHCGFAIKLDLSTLPIQTLKALDHLQIKVVTSDHLATLGRGDWSLKPEGKAFLVDDLVKRALRESEIEKLSLWFSQEQSAAQLTRCRYLMVEWCALSALAGVWNTSPIALAQRAAADNPALLLGVDAESCSRSELIFLALAHLCRSWDQSHLHHFQPSPATVAIAADLAQHLTAQLSERCHFAPTADEQRCWADQLRPLFNVVVATLLNQHEPPQPSDLAPLIRSLARLADQVFGDLQLADTLLNLLEPNGINDSPDRLRLQLRRGKALNVAIALFHQRMAHREPALGAFDQALALLELSNQSLVTTQAALERLLPLVPAWQQRNPRFSFTRRLLDQLGWHINTQAFALVDQLIALEQPASLGLAVREQSIAILSQIAQALWSDPGFGCRPLAPSPEPPQRWLLIGEQALSQCWLYRVEQKRLQLERLGSEVRCIDRGELDDWSCTELIAWADAVIFCRTPATYGVIRALTFARHAGKRVLAEVDDLVFTADFPAPYPSYGGSITPDHHL
ncbi:hypothetical protein IQ216_04915, partial [Cyanobium sp. LEGE 06143]|nr:hypothetical protein [Cyanobium sp. LEGE 06143]